MSAHLHDDLPARVEEILRGTRAAVHEAFAKPAESRRKDDGSTVTALDFALEREIGDALLAMDPDWGVRGEESGVIREGALMWHLDPVDGTANFARRSTQFASQLALMDGETILFSAVYEPLMDDYAYAINGGGAYREGHRLEAEDPDPAEAMVYADVAHSGIFMDQVDLLTTLRRAFYKLRMLGSVALQLRNVAAGVGDGYVSGRSYRIALHDMAPGVLLCTEAGRRVSDGAGGNPVATRRTLVAGTPGVHERICALLGSCA